MDGNFQALPPLKRFRLLQQLQENKENNIPISVQLPAKKRKLQELQGNKENNAPISLQLPAKKRKESRHSLLPEPTEVASAATYCLPAKKRVWALQPDLVSGKPLSTFDLNVEYTSYFDKKIKANEDGEETPLPITTNQPVEPHPQEKEHEEVSLLNDNSQSQFIKTTAQEEKEENKVEEEDDDDDGIVCAICQSTDGDPTDPIVFCDGCDLMVHSTCYGNPLIKGVPEGEWFCTQCLDSQSNKQNKAFSCCLCPTTGGAMKPTKDGFWAHVVCAVLVPEVFFEDPDGREGINYSKVPKRRWEGKCYVCKSRKGCVIQCSEPKCPLAFHVTCGLKEDLCIEYKEGKRKVETIVAGFCKSHTELWKKQQRTGKFKIVAREGHK
ncbi:hypothetical protein P3X46_006968 [Hevea brasiliensis]|uniref:PHD-type domain-containing protein n=1 Tax=Hevea brasiliensis TaxID=3981 RepID=A0ABQ9MRY9_HEVBR|nr:uncharacterized protein LOC110657952 [Hevea brasiliensis]KAJ9183052.1 hypothetical protein P3X46_006968 [Hevea brasiliensis]